MDKQVHRAPQGFQTLGKTTRAPMQPREVMPQFRIVAFHRKGLGFVEYRRVGCSTIVNIRIRRQPITEIPFSSRTLVNDILEDFKGTLGHDGMPDNTSRRAIHCGDHIDGVFFSRTKVYSSSSSVTVDVTGCGTGFGNRACAALIQLATV
jgi:hypothetical protein